MTESNLTVIYGDANEDSTTYTLDVPRGFTRFFFFFLITSRAMNYISILCLYLELSMANLKSIL